VAARILLIDDEPDMLALLRAIIEGQADLAVDATTSPKEAVGWLRQRDYELVVTDLRMPELDGLEVLAAVKQVDEKLPVVVLTAFGTIETAVAAMQHGAFDFMTKPFQKDAILVALRRALEWRGLHRQLRALHNELDERYRHLVGQSAIIREVERQLVQVAAVEVPVFLSGPRGSGKEAVARAIHKLSARREGPYVPLFCAGLDSGPSAGELTAKLFGGQGATGGLVAAAAGGSLFIDEVAALSLAAQKRLAEAASPGRRSLTGRQGTGRAEGLRLLAGSASPLAALRSQGRLSPELAELVAAFQIALPALAERREDIPLLAQYFVEKYARLYAKPVEEISELALRWLTGREWPGNVAELENVIQRGVIMARGKVVEEGDLIPADYVAQGLPYAAPDIFSLPLPEAEERLLASFVREYLRKSLARTRGDVAAAAAQAGVSKADFARLIKEYELEVLGAFGK
jgi:DNA-binding NtrC family response regulator